MSIIKFVLLSAAVSVSAQFAPVTFDTNKTPACKDIKCNPLECPPSFTWIKANDDDGINPSCCPICYNKELAEEAGAKEAVMPVGMALHPNAPATCRASEKGAQDTWCPQVDEKTCAKPVYNEGDCCWTCSADAVF